MFKKDIFDYKIGEYPIVGILLWGVVPLLGYSALGFFIKRIFL